MNDAMYVAATGLFAHQSNVESIANNVTNINTPTYKRSKVVFQDLIYREVNHTNSGSSARAVDLRGTGVGATTVFKNFAQGEIKQTGSGLDLAIQGEGFLEVVMPDGTTAYSRGGSFIVKEDGTLTLVAGYPLKTAITVPLEADSITISASGEVKAVSTKSGKSESIGTIELATFSDKTDLEPIGDNLYRAAADGARAVTATPGTDGAGILVQGALEMSNVSMVDEMVSLMVAQRAYEMSVKVMQAADEMVGMSNNLRRS